MLRGENQEWTSARIDRVNRRSTERGFLDSLGLQTIDSRAFVTLRKRGSPIARAHR
jgi:hypothetical protein